MSKYPEGVSGSSGYTNGYLTVEDGESTRELVNNSK
jgi:hypothetical protein